MQDKLEEIKAAWENRPAAGSASSSDEGEQLSKRDAEIVKLADQYVAENPALYEEYENKDIGECVQAVEAFRAAGLEQAEWQAQVWIFHAFEFQNIGGEAKAQVRMAPKVVEEDGK